MIKVDHIKSENYFPVTPFNWRYYSSYLGYFAEFEKLNKLYSKNFGTFSQMSYKLIRPEFYDEEYILNEQEYKEFNFVKVDPYWKVRSTAHTLSLSILGDKPTIIQRIEKLLFMNNLHNRLGSQQARDQAAIDIEMILKNQQRVQGQNIPYNSLEEFTQKVYKVKELEAKKVQEERVFRFQYPWQVVVELSKMDRSLSYPDIYKGLTYLMRPCSVFFNQFLESNRNSSIINLKDDTLTGIVVLPFSPKSLDSLNLVQLYFINRALDLKLAYRYIFLQYSFRTDLPNLVIEIYKQKLLDIFYLVEDSPRLHGITLCHSIKKPCGNLSSLFCANYMCKLCCQDAQHRSPCMIHDQYEQFFLHKLKTVFNFEEKINIKDRRHALRIHCRKLIRRYDLEKAFSDEPDIEWTNLNVNYHPTANRIEYIYLAFKSDKGPRRVLENKQTYIKRLGMIFMSKSNRLEKYDIDITPLSSSLYKKSEEPNRERVIVLLKPLSTLEVAQELPSGEDYRYKLVQLIQAITQLKPQEFKIEFDVNPVMLEADDRMVFIHLPTRQHVDKVYNAQPFFGCVVAHKLSHIGLMPFRRYDPNLCLMCSAKRNPSCVYDMCMDCCFRQMIGGTNCRCSSEQIPKAMTKRKNLKLNDDELCGDKCDQKRDPECQNKLCHACCVIQAVKVPCKVHEEPFFSRQTKKETQKILSQNQWKSDFYLFSRKMLQIVAEYHLKVRHELKNGRYDWFRPIYGTSVQNEMIRINKELQTVVDNGALVRNPNNKYRKDHKIFTFQANEPITTWISRSLKIYESINHKGMPFIEYTTNENTNREHKIWVKNSPNKYRTYTNDEFDQYMKQPNLAIRQNFHFMIFGLDRSTYTVREIYQEIYNKLSTLVGSIQMQSIMLLDNETLLSDIFALKNFAQIKNLNQNIMKMGRVACVKMDNILDSLCLITREVKITLPMSNGNMEEPIIYPSKFLLDFLANYNPETTILDVKSAGMHFSQMNKEIETITYNIRTVKEQTEDGGKKKKKKIHKIDRRDKSLEKKIKK